MSTKGWRLDDKRRIARFWKRTRIVGNCVEYTGARKARGYGLVVFDGIRTRAHRWIYERVIGPIPAQLGLLHSCDNPACVKLQHLEPGTQAQNMADCVARGRKAPTAARGERNGNSRANRSKRT